MVWIVIGIEVGGMILGGDNQGGGELCKDLQVSIVSNSKGTQLLSVLYCHNSTVIYIVAWTG